jgi:hypothetical protein
LSAALLLLAPVLHPAVVEVTDPPQIKVVARAVHVLQHVLVATRWGEGGAMRVRDTIDDNTKAD